MKHPILKKRTAGGEGIASAPFDVAITHPWDFDAYIVQYVGAYRLNKAHVDEEPMHMTVELYDFDTPGHAAVTEHVDWACSALERLPEGFQGCLTAGGFRAWTLRAEPFVIDSPERWEEWRAYHAGRAQALGLAIGAAPDEATDDPGRLFRLPNVVREDGKPCYPELVGELGVSTLAPLPVAVRSATAVSAGSARASMLGECFEALGWVRQVEETKLTVRCPWAHEHSGDELAVVYADESEMGKFHCGHTHCAGRYTNDVIEVIKATPSAAAVLDRWLYTAEEPSSSGDEPLPKVAGGEPVSQPVKAARFIGWPDLMTPMGEVPWLVKELEICPGRPPLFISDSGVGKTWTLQALALAVATGQPVFGRFPCRQGPVLHLSRDSGLRATKARYQRLARGMGIDRADVVVFPHSLPLTDKMGAFQRKGFEEVAREAERGGYALVILDSLAALCPGIDENSTDIGEPLRATTDDACVWLWAHHTTKSGEGYRGSGAIKAAAGSIYVGTRDGERRIWKALKASEEHESGDLPTFETEWQCDEGGGARIVAKMDGGPVTKVNEAQRAAWEMLKLVELHGKASTRELLAAAGLTSDVKGRARQKINAVLASLAHPAGGLLTSVEGDKYILSAGVQVPRAAHQIQVDTGN